jgi:glycosyltransferase involved in cell wall biosynthesis
MTRVGFLALQAPGLSPGQRYRVEAFLPYLQSSGIEVDYAWLLDAGNLRTFYGRSGVLRKGATAALGLFRRARSLLRARRWDVVFVQREAFFLFNEWSERLAALQAPLVFDFDDAVWIHAVSEANRRFAFLKNVEKIPRVAALAHTVIAGNDYLAAWARQHNPNVHVIPTCVDTDVFRPPPTRPTSGPVTIGWSGSPSTVAHLRLILPALERVKARLGDRVRLRVMGDPTFRYEPLNLTGEAWSPDAEVRFLQEMDIGLMPLPDDEWSKGKCGLKALTSMASGAATVLSPVGVNTTIATDGVTGFLPKTDDEWVEVLCRLVDDAPLRARIGAAGRDNVVSRYSVQRWKGPLAELLLAATKR